MQIFCNKGVFVDQIAIDPKKGSDFASAFITHGHSDHVSTKSNAHYYLSRETKALVEAKPTLMKKATPLGFKEKVRLDGCTVSLHNSGHILGAAQVLIEANQRVVVTSDFKLQPSLIQPAGEILPCDILVIESTFGLPCYSFPPREEVYQEIGAWVREKSKNGFVVLAGYSLGKAQELTAIVNKYAEITPLVHESIAKNNKVYEQFGVRLGDFIELQGNLRESSVLILPPSLVNHDMLQVLEFSLKKKIFSGLATGWTFKSWFDRVFTLSDHADFSQLMRYVQEANPKLVLTMHGFEREFASYVQRRLGVPARALGEKDQKTLTEFA